MSTTTAAAPRLFRKHSYANVIETCFDTPQIKLNRLTSDGQHIYVKCEFFNPLASVKDRIGKAMIEKAEAEGLLNPQTHVIEPTSGNTGIALAFVCAAKGYKLTLTMPESMSLERRALLRAFGAELVLTEASGGMKGAINKAAELAEADDNAWMPQQFENPANPEVHYQTTGAEIWNDSAGEVDILVSGVGTGGTITGAGRYLKEQNANIKCITVEPSDSPVIQQTLNGDPIKPGPHKIQGLAAGFVPRNCDLDLIDGVELITNDEAFDTARKLAKKEGILGGISTGANVLASLRVAEKNPGKNIVTIGCSFGERYLSTPMFEGLMQ